MDDATTYIEPEEYLKTFTDPYSWRVEDYEQFVEFACGCKYPKPPFKAWSSRCPIHDDGAISVGGPYKIRQG